MFDQDGFSNNGARSAWPCQTHDRADRMHEKNNDISRISQSYQTRQAIDFGLHHQFAHGHLWTVRKRFLKLGGPKRVVSAFAVIQDLNPHRSPLYAAHELI